MAAVFSITTTRLGACVFVLCVCGAVSSCGPGRTMAGVPSRGYDYSSVVAGIVKLHEEADAEWHERDMEDRHVGEEAAARLPEELDPNAYFGVLKHLSMADGFVLDYVYFDDTGNGGPLMYARGEAAAPFTSYDEYQQAVGGERPMPFPSDDAVLRYLDKVEADGSPESFFELVVLRELGGQFYRQWHFFYNDTRIIASREALDKLIAAHDRWSDAEGFAFTPGQARGAGRIDVRPQVRFLDENTVEVSLVTFTKWGGFRRNTYRIRRSFPHTFTDIERETLVEYDCGFVI